MVARCSRSNPKHWLATVTPLERFTSKYSLNAETGCWDWLGAVSHNYGKMHHLGQTVSAHRFSYLMFVGEIPDGMVVDHICNNKLCVNPDHLRVLTNQQNLARAKPTHCVNGHERTPENVDRWYACRQCRRERRRGTKADPAIGVK